MRNVPTAQTQAPRAKLEVMKRTGVRTRTAVPIQKAAKPKAMTAVKVMTPRQKAAKMDTGMAEKAVWDARKDWRKIEVSYRRT